MFVAMPTREIHPIVKTAPSATLKNRLHPQHGSAIGHVYVCRPGGGQHNSTVTCTQHPTMKSYTCILHVWGCKVAPCGHKTADSNINNFTSHEYCTAGMHYSHSTTPMCHTHTSVSPLKAWPHLCQELLLVTIISSQESLALILASTRAHELNLCYVSYKHC